MRTGTFELPSGHWTWCLMEFHEPSDWEVVKKILLCSDPSVDGNRMETRVPVEGQFGDEDLKQMAVTPDERRVVDADGNQWIARPQPRPLRHGRGQKSGAPPPADRLLDGWRAGRRYRPTRGDPTR